MSIFGEFLGNRYFILTAETGYDQRGYILVFNKTNEYGNNVGEATIGLRTNYIFTSLGARLKYQGKTVTPYIFIQPRADFYLGYNANLEDELDQYESEYKDPVLEDFKKVMFGVGVGAGIEFNRLLPFKTFIEANYNPAVTTSLSNSYVSVKENSFNIKIGINFIKDKKIK